MSRQKRIDFYLYLLALINRHNRDTHYPMEQLENHATYMHNCFESAQEQLNNLSETRPSPFLDKNSSSGIERLSSLLADYETLLGSVSSTLRDIRAQAQICIFMGQQKKTTTKTAINALINRHPPF